MRTRGASVKVVVAGIQTTVVELPPKHDLHVCGASALKSTWTIKEEVVPVVIYQLRV